MGSNSNITIHTGETSFEEKVLQFWFLADSELSKPLCDVNVWICFFYIDWCDVVDDFIISSSVVSNGDNDAVMTKPVWNVKRFQAN